MTQATLLQVTGLNKRFGGVLATDRVDLQVVTGEIHALIGPNGAGKTTLVAQIAGQLASDSGTVHFDGSDVTRMVTHQPTTSAPRVCWSDSAWRARAIGASKSCRTASSVRWRWA
jgi:ABC-type branched-subunit amino acid transport system ATPase component